MNVSLYIPCFNAQETIQRCLRAVFKQTYPIKRVIVVDDGSSDKTVERASRYQVKIIKHKVNKGLAATRNTAIKNIKTEFIASVDADCVPEPDWLLQLMKKFSSFRIAGAGGRLLEANSHTVYDRWRSVHMGQDWGVRETSPVFLFGSNSVFRKKALVKIGLYNDKFKTNYEDVDICQRLRKKGWGLAYEPNAIAHHFKKDSISSILNAYWRWNSAYYQKRGFYSNTKTFVSKIKDNLGLANRYIEEDLAEEENRLLYLDFLLALHHSLRDFEYFVSQNDRKYQHPDYDPLSIWLSLVDLTFFYHFCPKKNKLSTLIPQEDASLQNFFALNLLLGKFVWKNFNNSSFRRIIYKDLLLSVYKIEDANLLDRLLNLIELHPDWDGFLKKKHPNLNSIFLKSLFFNLRSWLKNLVCRFPNIIKMIEVSAEKTHKLSPDKKGR